MSVLALSPADRNQPSRKRLWESETAELAAQHTPTPKRRYLEAGRRPLEVWVAHLSARFGMTDKARSKIVHCAFLSALRRT